MQNPEFVSMKRKAGGRLRSLREFSHETRDYFGYAHEETVISRTPLKDVEAPLLFTYMHRRFGMGNVGSDPYKDLGAGWLISTPREDLCLMVRPSFNGAGFSFIPYVVAPRDNGGFEITEEEFPVFAAAYERTLIDLLRPVCERDIDFNALGQLDDGDNAVPEGFQGERSMYHETAGLPMPEGVFGGDEWHRLLSYLSNKGGGDMAEGRRLLLAEAETEVFDHLATLDQDILPLVAAGIMMTSDGSSPRFIERLGLSEAGTQRANEFIKEGWNAVPSKDASDWLRSVDDDFVEAAVDAVDALGLDTDRLSSTWSEIKQAKLFHDEWHNFFSLCNGEFDLDMVPDHVFPTDKTVDAVLVALADAGKVKVNDWAAALQTTKEGRRALYAIVEQLWNQKQRELEKEKTRTI